MGLSKKLGYVETLCFLHDLSFQNKAYNRYELLKLCESAGINLSQQVFYNIFEDLLKKGIMVEAETRMGNNGSLSQTYRLNTKSIKDLIASLNITKRVYMVIMNYVTPLSMISSFYSDKERKKFPYELGHKKDLIIKETN